MYAFAHNNSRPLLLYDRTLISYHGDIESRMLQIRITRSDTRNVRYDRSYTKAPNTKNPDRMLGFFIALKIVLS